MGKDRNPADVALSHPMSRMAQQIRVDIAPGVILRFQEYLVAGTAYLVYGGLRFFVVWPVQIVEHTALQEFRWPQVGAQPIGQCPPVEEACQGQILARRVATHAHHVGSVYEN
jgi:hypothetical protein